MSVVVSLRVWHQMMATVLCWLYIRCPSMYSLSIAVRSTESRQTSGGLSTDQRAYGRRADSGVRECILVIGQKSYALVDAPSPELG